MTCASATRQIVVGLGPAIAAVALVSCATTAERQIAPANDPAGYPIFVRANGLACEYQVQDMIFEAPDLRDWMNQLGYKSRQVDIVIDGQLNHCAVRTERIARAAGFSDVRFRRLGDASYPSGLPPS